MADMTLCDFQGWVFKTQHSLIYWHTCSLSHYVRNPNTPRLPSWEEVHKGKPYIDTVVESPAFKISQTRQLTCEWKSLQIVSASSSLRHTQVSESSELRPQTLWPKENRIPSALCEFPTHIIYKHNILI